MATPIDEQMERASESLAKRDYLACERQCLEAIAIARQQQAWSDYARILLPLQECRRQRRMIAAEGMVRLGTADLGSDPLAWLHDFDAGCIVVTRPHDADVARSLADAAWQQQRFIEVLFADCDTGADPWTLRSFAGPSVSCPMPAPPGPWRNLWLEATAEAPTPSEQFDRPIDWFLDAAEKLGDAALEQVQAPGGDPARVAELEQRLQVVRDHEILHQRLYDAARAVR